MPHDHRAPPSPDELVTADGPPVLRQFVLKVHSRCDLACDYCYVYTMRDRSWMRQPRVMSAATVARTADRIAEHVAAHGLTAVDLVLHGGEPLLAGPERLADCVRSIRAAVAPAATVRATVQTNGVRLDERFLQIFGELDVRVGVSLDGGRATHDRHRRDHAGRGTHARVARALRLLRSPAHRDRYAGLLCTVDVRTDPVAVYRGLLEHEPPAVDLLLPHGSWSDPPPGRDTGSSAEPYGRWLAAVFDAWFTAGRPGPRVRIFDSIIALLLGGRSTSEGIGLGRPAAAVVGTNGDLQESDHLAATSGGTATGLSVWNGSFDDLLASPVARARRAGIAGLSAQCRSCALVRVCGGGLFSHRFGGLGDFDRPSVYCPDLAFIIRHVRDRLHAAVTAPAGRPS